MVVLFLVFAAGALARTLVLAATVLAALGVLIVFFAVVVVAIKNFLVDG